MTKNQNPIFRQACRWVASTVVLLGLTLGLQAQTTNIDLQATQAAADKGDAKAQYELGRYYAKAPGGKKDYAKATQYARQAADQGYAPAQVMLGSFYGQGMGVRRNLPTAVQWYRRAADQGNALAQYAMGSFYLNGRGVTNDAGEAVKWWRKAAAQNQVSAEAALGQLYLIPLAPYGTKYINYEEANRFLHQAVAHGSVVALNNLGVAYENGLGVPRDFAQAAYWYREAAERGDAQGQANLGQLYFDGRGVTNDLVQAYMWFKLSAGQGNNLGTTGLGSFQSRELLTPKQIAEAEQMVLNFRPRQSQNQL